jgi:hypothetical protein
MYKIHQYSFIEAQIHTDKELLRMNSKGEFLTHKDKERLKKVAENKRKKNLSK